MLDDEDTGGSGLGGPAWYQMGRWAAETDRDRQDLCDVLTGNAPVSRADYNYVVSLNEGLSRESANLRGEISKGNEWLREWKGLWEGLKARYDQLKVTADRDAGALAELNEAYERSQNRADRLLNALSQSSESLDKLLKGYGELEARQAKYEADLAAGRLIYRNQSGNSLSPDAYTRARGA